MEKSDRSVDPIMDYNCNGVMLKKNLGGTKWKAFDDEIFRDFLIKIKVSF